MGDVGPILEDASANENVYICKVCQTVSCLHSNTVICNVREIKVLQMSGHF